MDDAGNTKDDLKLPEDDLAKEARAQAARAHVLTPARAHMCPV